MNLFVSLVFPVVAVFLSCFGFLFSLYDPKGPSAFSLVVFGFFMVFSLFVFLVVL
ncbi:hypothetical protein D9M71_719750 [compost metagenome]